MNDYAMCLINRAAFIAGKRAPTDDHRICGRFYVWGEAPNIEFGR